MQNVLKTDLARFVRGQVIAPEKFQAILGDPAAIRELSLHVWLRGSFSWSSWSRRRQGFRHEHSAPNGC